MNLKKVLTIILSILIIIAGFYCLFNPTMTYLSVGYLVGVIILFDSITNITIWADAKKYVEVSGWYLASAIISLIFSIVLLVSVRMQFIVDLMIIYMIAAWIITMGIMRISLAIRMKKVMDKIPVFKNKKRMAVLALGILMILFGIVCFFEPTVLSTMLGLFIGFMIIVIGCNLLTIGMYAY